MLTKRLSQIVLFLKEIEKLKLVERIPYLSDGVRQENDAEHSWHLAMMLLTLEKEFENKFDTLHTLKIVLVHDLIEIHTGDDWVTDDEAKKKKQENETAAAKKLFSLLPADLQKEFYDLWQEYDLGKTIESKIAKALDKLSYSLQHSISRKINWHEYADSVESTRNYAAPYIHIEKVLNDILEDLLIDRVQNHDQYKWVPRA